MSGLDVDLPEGGEGAPEGGGEGESNKYEDLARAEGWRPKEQFRGDPDEWVDAETFVRRGREINPILRRNNERLQSEINRLGGQLKEATDAVKNLQEYNAKLEQKAYERAIKKIKEERRAAIASGDHATAAELEDELDELREQKPEPAPPPKKEEPAAQQQDPILVAWMSENKSWFNDDPDNEEMVIYANTVGQMLRRRDPQMQKWKGQSFLDEIRARVVKQFPDRFGRRAGGSAMVEGSGGPASGEGAGGKGGSKSLASLPAEARSQFKQLNSEKWYQDLAKSKNMTTEQMFMADYGE